MPTNAHRWDIARGPLPCKRSCCTTTIGAGEPYRRVSKGEYPYCAPCAKAVFDEDPPEDLPAQTYAKRMERFKPKAEGFESAAQLARTPLNDLLAKVTESVPMDYGQRAANDREPGEEG